MKHYVTLSLYLLFLYPRDVLVEGPWSWNEAGDGQHPNIPKPPLFLIRGAVARDDRFRRIWSAGWWYQSATDINWPFSRPQIRVKHTPLWSYPGFDKHQLSAGKTTLRRNLSCLSKIWRLLANPLCSNVKSFKKNNCFICGFLRRCLKVCFCRAFFNHQPVLINNKASLLTSPTASLGVFRIYTQGSCQCRLSQFGKTERVENYHNRIIEFSSFHPSIDTCKIRRSIFPKGLRSSTPNQLPKSCGIPFSGLRSQPYEGVPGLNKPSCQSQRLELPKQNTHSRRDIQDI